MKKPITMLSLIVLILMSYPLHGQCYELEFGGQVSSLFVLRDTSGFQDGFMDNLRGVQWRNTLEFDLTLKPEYEGRPSFYLNKVFLSYRGSYDAIFECRTDEYNNVLEKSRDDFELGMDDIEWENDLREVFVDIVAEEGAQKVNLRLGRQIVRWGETDSFNVINVPNPSDFSYQMAFSDPDDLAIPLWMGRLNYTKTGAGPFDTIGIELLAIPDIRPTQMAPLSGKDGFFCFDAPYAYTLSGYDGMGLTRIREDTASNSWENMEYAISVSFGIGALEAAFHYFVGYQDAGAIDFTDYMTWASSGGLAGAPQLTFIHPRQRTYGYSFNYFVEFINGVVRSEGALTDKMYLMEQPDFVSNFDISAIEPAKVYQVLLGFDKDLHPSWIGTRSALGCAFEAYWKHVNDWETDKDIHPATKEDTYIFTALFYTDYYNGRVKPTIMAMYDTEGTWMTNMSLVYDMDGRWLFKLAQSSFWGNRDSISDFSYGGALIDNSELSLKVSYRF